MIPPFTDDWVEPEDELVTSSVAEQEDTLHEEEFHDDEEMGAGFSDHDADYEIGKQLYEDLNV